ncbi:MAG: sulfatase-like hydrolase/transferase [Sedimentitalea sp.]
MGLADVTNPRTGPIPIPGAAQRNKKSQPNIVLIMVDQLTSFVLNAYGDTVCKTPNIDGLAARGTVYDTAYCAYPLCLPSRYSMMTGRLPSKIGAYDNGAELPAATPTFAHYLRSAGYQGTF